MARWVLLAAVALCAAPAGCIDPAPEDAAEPTPRPITTGSSGPPVGHVHDLWGAQTQRLLMESQISLTTAHNHQFDEPPRAQHTHGCSGELVSDSQGGSTRFTLPPGEIVLPGTAALEITLAWDQPSITGLRLLYKPPGHDHDHGDAYMDAGIVENGATATIPLTPTMADAGHAVQSHWAFFLCAAGSDPLSVAEGTARMTVVAHRAQELPVDPPHPDPWGARQELVLGDLSWAGEAWAAAYQHGDAWHQVTLDEGRIVPWGTTAVEVRLWANGSSAPLDPSLFTLYTKDCREPRWIFTAVEAETSEDALVFRIDIDDADMLDGPYATTTDWQFWIRIASSAGVAMPLGLGTWTAPHVYQGSLEAQVVARAS